MRLAIVVLNSLKVCFKKVGFSLTTFALNSRCRDFVEGKNIIFSFWFLCSKSFDFVELWFNEFREVWRKVSKKRVFIPSRLSLNRCDHLYSQKTRRNWMKKVFRFCEIVKFLRKFIVIYFQIYLRYCSYSFIRSFITDGENWEPFLREFFFEFLFQSYF